MTFDGLLSTVDAFLPYPVYNFVGGPCDGQKIEVNMIDLGDDRGLMAPDIWNVRVALALPPISFFKNEPIPVQAKYEVASYRFVAGRRRNTGYYRFVAD